MRLLQQDVWQIRGKDNSDTIMLRFSAFNGIDERQKYVPCILLFVKAVAEPDLHKLFPPSPYFFNPDLKNLNCTY